MRWLLSRRHISLTDPDSLRWHFRNNVALAARKTATAALVSEGWMRSTGKCQSLLIHQSSPNGYPPIEKELALVTGKATRKTLGQPVEGTDNAALRPSPDDCQVQKLVLKTGHASTWSALFINPGWHPFGTSFDTGLTRH